MDTVIGVARDLALFAVVVAVLLAPLHVFLRYRLRRAHARPDGAHYVPLADRWIPAIILLSGVGLLVLLATVR